MKSIIKHSILPLVALMPLLTACQSEPEVGTPLHPVDAETYGAKVYINEIATPTNVSSAKILQTPSELIYSPDTCQFYVHLTQPLSTDVTVTVAESEEAATTYDGEATALPVGTLKVLTGTVTIPAGATVSTEPVRYVAPESEALRSFTGKAVSALALQSVSGSNDVKVGSDHNAYYQVFTKVVTNYKGQSTSDLAAHTQLAYSTYSVSIDGQATTDLSDDNTNTYYMDYDNGGGFEVLFTLDQAQKVGALSFKYGYSWGYVPVTVEILTSNDGTEWTSQTGGEVQNEQISYSCKDIPFCFYSAVPCRYVKLRVVDCYYGIYYGSEYNYPCVSEVKLYE